MNFKQIASELAADLKRPSVHERTVTEDELKAAAAHMAKRGYVPSAAALSALEKYMQGYALWLSGDVGTGKTMFFRCVPRMRTAINTDGAIAFLPMGAILDWSVGDLSAFLRENAGSEVVIDDAGREPQFVEYGKRFEVLPWIVEKRMESASRTHFTTNFPKKFFDERYGYGLFDRMRSLAYHVRFDGESMRTLRPRIKFKAREETATPPTPPAPPTPEQ